MYALANHVTSIMLLITGVYNCMSYSCSSGFLQTQGITGITKSQLLKFHYWWNRRCGGMLLQKHAHVHRSPKIFWFIIIQFNAKTCKSAGQLVATWQSYRKAQMWPKTKFLNSVIAMSVAQVLPVFEEPFWVAHFWCSPFIGTWRSELCGIIRHNSLSGSGAGTWCKRNITGQGTLSSRPCCSLTLPSTEVIPWSDTPVLIADFSRSFVSLETSQFDCFLWVASA